MKGYCIVRIYNDNGDEYGKYCGSKTFLGVDSEYLSGYLQALVDKGYRPEIDRELDNTNIYDDGRLK